MATYAERHAKRQVRIDDLRNATKVRMVKVLPRDEAIRKHIAHMPSNIRFPKEGPAKWPYDKFTQRRIADGDVTIVTEDAPKAESSLQPPWHYDS